jgi:hypothetical protein
LATQSSEVEAEVAFVDPEVHKKWFNGSRYSQSKAIDKNRSPEDTYNHDRHGFPFAKFWGLVDRSGEPNSCWPWMGRMHAGYGHFIPKMCGSFKANRIALTIKLKRDLLPGMETLHSCDNGRCCNPNHLSEGTHAQNMREVSERGAWRRKHASAGEKG